MRHILTSLITIIVLSACSMKRETTEQATTIDSTLQAKVTSILESKLEEFNAQLGQVVVMEV